MIKENTLKMRKVLVGGFFIFIPAYACIFYCNFFYHHQLKCSISSRDILCHRKVKRQTVCCNYIYAVKSVRRRRHRFCATIYFKHVPRPFIPKTFLLEKAFCIYVLYIARLSNELTKLIFRHKHNYFGITLQVMSLKI